MVVKTWRSLALALALACWLAGSGAGGPLAAVTVVVNHPGFERDSPRAVGAQLAAEADPLSIHAQEVIQFGEVASVGSPAHDVEPGLKDAERREQDVALLDRDEYQCDEAVARGVSVSGQAVVLEVDLAVDGVAAVASHASCEVVLLLGCQSCVEDRDS